MPTNKVLEAILTNIILLYHKYWVDMILEALWAYRTIQRNTTGHTPYKLAYGKKILILIEFQVNTFQMVMQLGLDMIEAQ